MAIDQQKVFTNTKGSKSVNNKSTLRFTITTVSTDDEGNQTFGSSTREIGDIIKNVWMEVPNGPGVDPTGADLSRITSGVRCENMYRYDSVSPADIDWNDDEDEDLEDSSLLHSYIYAQGTRDVLDKNKLTGKWEYYARPEYTYEEEYFQHIFNWPTTHTTQPRKIAGLLEDKVDTYTTVEGETETATTSCEVSTSYTYYDVVATYPAQNLTLQKVDQKLYYINDDWTYSELVLNDDGTINNSTFAEKLGAPIIYQGSTDDKTKLFFHYKVTGNDLGTSQVIAVGDSIGGITVTNVVNYVVSVAIKRIVSFHSEKRTEDKGFLPSTDPAYDDTKGWIKLDKIVNIQVNDKVWGDGIAGDTKVTKVDTSNNIVYLSRTVRSNKVRQVLLRNSAVNQVSKETLCYAELASDANFSTDGEYAVTRNGQTVATVIARAGAGIINRSAIVGTYFSSGKKEVEYIPIFYAADGKCQKIEIEDENGKYVLGTRIYGDNSRDSGIFILTEPKNNEVYQIAAMYFSATRGPIDKVNLEKFLKNYRDNGGKYIDTLKLINNYAENTLGGKKVAGTIDDACGDTIDLVFNKIYLPVEELDTFNTNKDGMNGAINDFDVCYPYTSESGNPTIEEQIEKIKNIVDKSVKSTSLLNKEYYDRLVGNEDSLINRINKGLEISNSAQPNDTTYSNLPPQVEGQDGSGQPFRVKNYRDLPPAMDRVKYFMNDLIIGTEEDFNPSLDLDPATTHNQPKIIISSSPVWTGADESWEVTQSFDLTQVTIGVDITYKSYNGVNGIENITPTIGGPTPSSVKIPDIPLATCDYVLHTYTMIDPNNESDNRLKDHKKTFEQNGYVAGVSWHVHPDLRDLDNKNWPDDPTEDNDEDKYLVMPPGALNPKFLWRPNVNYQRDFHKMFWFRPKEVADLIGQTILNRGNPYVDDSITAKITKSIEESDTTINVDSTDGFLSSGYLIIPKYIKKIFTVETGNTDSEFTYFGEEIIYYGSKTQTTFQNCVRNCFATVGKYPEVIPTSKMEVGTRYQIHDLGDTDWESLGATNDAKVGDVFVAKKEADSTGFIDIELLVSWDDNPSTAGIALESISWSGTGYSFSRPDTEVGRKVIGNKKEELYSGTYNVNMVGNSGGFEKRNKRKLVFFDQSGTDANTTIEINIKDRFGEKIDAYFDDNGNIVITGEEGTTFGTGLVTVYGMKKEEIPRANIIPGVEEPATVPSISSYEKGHSVAQHWIFRLKE